MSQKALSMRKIKEVLRVRYDLGLLQNEIARSCSIEVVQTKQNSAERGIRPLRRGPQPPVRILYLPWLPKTQSELETRKSCLHADTLCRRN
jgi:hypothetical protein